MKVKTLISKLSKMDQNMPVSVMVAGVPCDDKDAHDYMFAHKIKVQEATTLKSKDMICLIQGKLEEELQA